jgi:hypothetical protein
VLVHLMLPRRPSEELSDAELDDVAGGTAIVMLTCSTW